MPLELAGQKNLAFDLYDENGEIVYNSGDELSPGFLMQLSYKKVFKNDSQIVKTYTIYEPKSVISEKTTRLLVTSTKNILKKAYENDKPDLETCQNAANIILEEVSENLENVQCISQLRIFDEYTFSHTVNVSTMSSALGMLLDLDEQQLKDLALGALLHDIGKMRVPKDILNKPARLEPEEFTIMKSHTLLGYNYIIENLEVSDEIAKVALDHQEKYSGGGYPNNLKGKEISFFAQIASIADVYDALISNRVYKKAIELDRATDILLAESNKCFNPYMLKKFLKFTGFENKADMIEL
jgi:putative nucleotidyltransferase with HDIG domain